MKRFIITVLLLAAGCPAPHRQTQTTASTVGPAPVSVTPPSPSSPPVESAAPTTVPSSDATVTSEKWPTAFKRRCYQLGITISQFKTIKHPDDPSAFPVFSNEDRARDYSLPGARLEGPLAEVGVIKCFYFYRAEGSRYRRAELKLGRVGCYTAFYFYPESEGKEPVLYYIDSWVPSAWFDEVVDWYRRAMGAPTSVQSKQVQNKLGATFTNETVEYRNDVSGIDIIKFGDTLDMSNVQYFLGPVSARIIQKLDSLKQDDARKL